MLAYPCFVADNPLEQQLLTSVRIGSFLYQYACSLIAQTEKLTYRMLMAGNKYPFWLKKQDNAYAQLPVCNSSQGEEQRISWEMFVTQDTSYAQLSLRNPIQGERERVSWEMFVKQDSSTWHLMLHPVRGRISPARLQMFCDYLSSLEGPQATAKQREIGYVTSLVPYRSLAHPLWQLVATEHYKSTGSSIHFSSFGGPHTQSKEALFAHCSAKQVHDSPQGSQHVQELYYDDNALYAFRYDWNFGPDEQAVQPHPVFIPKECYMQGLPVFFQLPLFEMDPYSAIDCTTLEKSVPAL